MISFTGKCSAFGGPTDFGVAPGEGLALFEPEDVASHPELFLSHQPPGTSGVARRLNPQAFYCACRWDYNEFSREFLRTHKVLITNIKTGKSAQAQPTDWGPNIDTGRVCDMSPGILDFLVLNTDDLVRVDIDAGN